MKQTVLLLFALLLCGIAAAQVDSDAFKKRQQQMREEFERQRSGMRQRYDDERKKAEAEYAAFRKKANEEYAAAMERAWQLMGVQPAVPKPKEPAPPVPPAPKPDAVPPTVPLPQAPVQPPAPKEEPVPTPPIPQPAPATPTVQFALYGTGCSFHADASQLTFRLKSTDEQSISDVWKSLSKGQYDGMLHDCLAQRDKLRLGDWGYLQLLQSATEKLLGTGSNEAVLLQMYLLAQSGYRVRLANADGRLVLLIPFNTTIYGYSYVTIDGANYYVIAKDDMKQMKICNVGFPREQTASIILASLPLLDSKPQPQRLFAAERFGTMRAEVSVDKSLINFLNDYPLSENWNYYVQTGLSDGIKASLYPALRSQIEGKSQSKAVRMLLDFVQTAFQYATDQDQFGYERPLFGDESFHYPKNDCEDRSILFAILVRDLLGMEVVLVNWPGHLATAVAFDSEVQGSYFTIGGKRFTVCDPTYIGAGVGETMPQFKDVDAKLVMI